MSSCNKHTIVEYEKGCCVDFLFVSLFVCWPWVCDRWMRQSEDRVYEMEGDRNKAAAFCSDSGDCDGEWNGEVKMLLVVSWFVFVVAGTGTRAYLVVVVVVVVQETLVTVRQSQQARRKRKQRKRTTEQLGENTTVTSPYLWVCHLSNLWKVRKKLLDSWVLEVLRFFFNNYY